MDWNFYLGLGVFMIFLSGFFMVQRVQWKNMSENQKRKNFFIVGLIVLVALFAVISFYVLTINNFDECVKAGYPIIEGNPRYCIIDNSNVFAEKIK